MDLYHVTE